MDPRLDLMGAVLAAPADDAPRLRLAEWLERQGDPQGEFIRLQCESARDIPGEGFADRERARAAREQELLSQHETRWAAPVALRVRRYSFHRGLIDHVALPARELLDRGAQLFAVAPIRHVDLTEAAPYAAELFASPLLEKVVTLSLVENRLGDLGVAALAASQRLRRLRWLDLGGNDLTQRGCEYLAASPNLASLRVVSLLDNPCNPIAGDGRDWPGGVAQVRETDQARKLEARYGRKEWLHGRGGAGAPASRFELR